MGRSFFSKSGIIKLWVNQTNGPETSQQVADWYSITHMLHGIALYFLIWLVARRKWRLGFCMLLAIAAEAAWEIFENCPYTINRFRAATAADGYYGDSILNSFFDSIFSLAGFFLARYLPAWATILFIVITEVGLALAVRDNLTLNIIMLIHPFESIKHWQMGG